MRESALGGGVQLLTEYVRRRHARCSVTVALTNLGNVCVRLQRHNGKLGRDIEVETFELRIAQKELAYPDGIERVMEMIDAKLAPDESWRLHQDYV